MKLKTAALLLLCAFTTNISAQESFRPWGDQGNGTYVNPILPADYSDPDAIRVGNKYYMVASDFHFIGMQILESHDLVNWRVVAQLYHRLDFPAYDSNSRYAGGSWAPSLRYHNGEFYVYFCTPHEGLFMTKSSRAEGPWEPLTLVQKIERWEDPCPFWDEDGQAYLGHSVHGAGPIIVHRMSADGKRLLDSGTTVYQGPVAEGTKFYKRNGWYYLCIPEGGVGQGWQTALRSRSIYGPYERKVVLEQGSTAVNGPHQGAMVDTPNGQWWFLHFQEKSPLGRVVHLEPMRWVDDWPLMGIDIDGNGVGEPVYVWQKPDITATASDTIQTSDNFNSAILSPVWQFNHNPADGKWSLTENAGHLTLHALKAPNFKLARNTLTQKTMGYGGHAEVTVSLSQLEKHTKCGLALMGKVNNQIGISQNSKGENFIYASKEDTIVATKPLLGGTESIDLRIDIKPQPGHYSLSYRVGSEPWQPLMADFTARSGFWKGVRVALYCYNTKADKGTALFSHFVYDTGRRR